MRTKLTVSEDKLKKIRIKIDSIDDKINDLLAERATCAEEVKAVKGGTAIYRPKREAEILDRVAAEHTGSLPDSSVRSIYTEIIASCRNLEEQLTVTYLGPPGSYSHEIAQKMHGRSSTFIAEQTLHDVVSSVEKGSAEVAVIPIENSSEGPVVEAQKILQNTNLKISREGRLKIQHNLLGTSVLEDVKTVYAHPQALGQCRVWLQANIPNVELVSVSSNSEAARRATDTDSVAAIASLEAADLYNLDILAQAINDESGNQTRFFVLSENQAEQTGDDKTALIVTLKDEPGSLHSLLGEFVKHTIDLMNLKSQPAGKDAHNFFIELTGHSEDAAVAKALSEIRRHSKHTQVLGSYPREDTIL